MDKPTVGGLRLHSGAGYAASPAESEAVLNNDLIRRDGGYDCAAITRDAHRQFRVMGRHGWSFSRCLSYSWTRARAQRERAAWSLVVAAAQAALARGGARVFW